MDTLADRTIAALRSGHEEVAEIVRGLDHDALVGPSGASEWQLSQVLSHLGSGAEIFLALLDSALDGTPAPTGEFNQSVWARWDAMSADAHAAGFLETNQKLVDRYEALDPTARETLRIDFGFLPEPVDVALAAGLRLGEFALHQWDIEVAFDPEATVSPEAVPLLLDRLGLMLGRVAKVDALAGRKASLTLRLSEPDRNLGLLLGDSVELTDTPPSDSDGEITAPAEAWLRLASGRLGAGHTPDGVAVTGPLTLDDLREVFPGY